MYPGWAEIFDEFLDPGCQYTELVVAAGMKAGKSYHVGGLISCYEMYLLSQYDNPALAMGLDPDSWIWGLCAARNRKQAKDAVFAEFLAKAKRCPAFQELDCDATTMEFKIFDKKLDPYLARGRIHIRYRFEMSKAMTPAPTWLKIARKTAEQRWGTRAGKQAAEALQEAATPKRRQPGLRQLTVGLLKKVALLSR